MRSQETIPFYPAPVNAAGGCSCNMGNVLQNATASIELIESKCTNYQLTGGSALSDCQCCAWSAALSSYVTFPSQGVLAIHDVQLTAT